MSNYATKSALKGVTGIDSKTSLANLKPDVDRLDIDIEVYVLYFDGLTILYKK